MKNIISFSSCNENIGKNMTSGHVYVDTTTKEEMLVFEVPTNEESIILLPEKTDVYENARIPYDKWILLFTEEDTAQSTAKPFHAVMKNLNADKKKNANGGRYIIPPMTRTEYSLLTANVKEITWDNKIRKYPSLYFSRNAFRIYSLIVRLSMESKIRMLTFRNAYKRIYKSSSLNNDLIDLVTYNYIRIEHGNIEPVFRQYEPLIATYVNEDEYEMFMKAYKKSI